MMLLGWYPFGTGRPEPLSRRTKDPASLAVKAVASSLYPLRS